MTTGATTVHPITPVRSTARVGRLGTLLGVWAHPDDEVYLSAALMAAAAAAGNRVVVVTATRGERGTDDPAAWPPARLARERERELAASLAVLDGGRGGIEHRFLGDRTGVCHLDGALHLGPADGAVAELAEIVDEVAPDTVLTFGPDGITGHPDHRAVSGWTDRAVQRAARPGPRVLHAAVTEAFTSEFADLLVPIDGSEDAYTPVARRRLAVDLELAGAELDRKVTALRAHAGQVGPLLDLVGAERYRRLVAGEWFVPAARPGAS